MGSAFTKSALETPVLVEHGGTGLATLTSNSYYKGNGTSAPTARTYSEVRTDLNVADGATANTKATGAEINAVADDVKFATSKAIGDSTIKMWKIIPAANYTTGPASTSTITMGVDMTTSVLVGKSLRYTIGGTEYFGMVTAIAANLLTVAGAPLSGNVTNLQYGGGMVQQITYSNADSLSVVTTGTKYTLRWNKEKSYMVFYQVKMIGHDTHATEAKLTWEINATEVNSSAGGLSISANNTWYSTVVDVAIAAYDVNRGEDITLVATQGGSIDGYGIVANCIIITP
jgi:hypothetical protein